MQFNQCSMSILLSIIASRIKHWVFPLTHLCTLSILCFLKTAKLYCINDQRYHKGCSSIYKYVHTSPSLLSFTKYNHIYLYIKYHQYSILWKKGLINMTAQDNLHTTCALHDLHQRNKRITALHSPFMHSIIQFLD